MLEIADPIHSVQMILVLEFILAKFPLRMTVFQCDFHWVLKSTNNYVLGKPREN